MKDSTAVVIRREDYRPPPYTIERVDLTFQLDETATRVTAKSLVVRAPGTPADAKGKSISFGVRPEDLRVATGGAGVLFEGKVDYIEQLGEVQLVYVDIGRPNEPVTAKLPGNADVKRGETLRLSADAGDLHIFDDKGLSFARPRIEAKAA